MAAVIKLDTFANAELELTYFQTTRQRSGVITGIPIAGVDNALVLETVYNTPDFPQLSSGYPANPAWRLSTVRIMPMSADSARFVLTYSTAEWGQTVYLIRDASYVNTISTQLMPGPLKTPFRVSYDPGGGVVAIPESSVSMTLMGIIRSISITYISYGSPPTGLRPYVKYVNNDNFLGLGSAYWLLTKFESDLSKYSGAYQVESEITTKCDEDWSAWGTLQDSQTGLFSDVSAATADAQSRPYSYGIIYPYDGPTKKKGLLRVGPYQQTSFNSLFPAIGT